MVPPENDISSADEPALPEHWKAVKSSGALHRRFEFDNYSEVSAFLETYAKLSEETGVYPDLSFATTYVNVTIPSGEDEEAISLQHAFADRSNKIFEEQKT